MMTPPMKIHALKVLRSAISDADEARFLLDKHRHSCRVGKCCSMVSMKNAHHKAQKKEAVSIG